MIHSCVWYCFYIFVCLFFFPPVKLFLHLNLEIAVIQPFPFEEKGLNGGTSTKIICTITAGDSPVSITWYKDDIPFKQNEKKRIVPLDESTSMLSLSKLDLEDSGTYTCQASNSAGITKYSSVLRVKGTVMKATYKVLENIELSDLCFITVIIELNFVFFFIYCIYFFRVNIFFFYFPSLYTIISYIL